MTEELSDFKSLADAFSVMSSNFNKINGALAVHVEITFYAGAIYASRAMSTINQGLDPVRARDLLEETHRIYNHQDVRTRIIATAFNDWQVKNSLAFNETDRKTFELGAIMCVHLVTDGLWETVNAASLQRVRDELAATIKRRAHRLS